ncbi:MAG: 4-(cytidine 5'-diphospho)-2-C-methyl-D-erythritol kinase [Candidatus Acidiferrales bacterium]
MSAIRLRAFAKVNLRLEILGRRADGYHELRTIFQTISLHDTLELSPLRGSRVELRIEGNDSLAAESLKNNLVYRAIEAARRELGWRRGVRARLVKCIPVGRGLGGGSSDAAAALIGMMRLARKEIPADRLIEIGSSLGADVPFFLYGGTALGIGRGDEIYPLPDAPHSSVLVVSPHSIAVPTVKAYKWLTVKPLALARPQLTKRRTTSRLSNFCALCWSAQGVALANRFEAAVFPRYPRLRNIKQELLRLGAGEATLAGSGSAVFALFRSPAMARRAAQAFPKDSVFICETVSRGDFRRARLGRGSV